MLPAFATSDSLNDASGDKHSKPNEIPPSSKSEVHDLIPNQRMLQQQSALSQLVMNTIQSSSSRSISMQAKSPTRETSISFKPMATVEDHTIQIGQQLTISGNLASGAPWSDETVVLVREGYANLTTTTDANGDYQFQVTYGTADIGAHNYSVEFPGNPSLLRLAATLKTGKIVVTDAITMFATTDQNPAKIAPNTNYNILVSFEHSDSTPFDPSTATFFDEFNQQIDLSALRFDISETYNPTSGGSADSSTAVNLVDQSITGSTVTIPSNSGSQSVSIEILLTVTLKNYQGLSTYLTFNSETDANNPTISNKKILDIEINYVFTLSMTINNQAFSSTTRYYRSNQLVKVDGTLSLSGGDPSNVVGVEYNFRIVYNSQTLVNKFGKTNSTGQFTETFNLNTTTWFDPTKDITVTAIMNSNGNTSISGLDPDTISRVIKMYEYVDKIVAVKTVPSTSTVFLTANNQVTLTGYVQDVQARNASSVSLRFLLLDNTNSIVQTFSQFTTNSTGGFSSTLTLPGTTAGNGTFSFLAEVVNGTFSSSIWYITTAKNTSFGLFNYTNSLTFTVARDLEGGTFTDGENNRIFNQTFEQLLQNANTNITVSIRDAFGRAPLGFKFKLSETIVQTSTTTTLEFTINSTNNGDFIVLISPFSQILDTSGPNQNRLLNRAEDQFIYKIEILNPSSSTLVSRSETYTNFGPDENPVNLNAASLTVVGADGNSPSNIAISIALSDPNEIDNVRNITIAYRYSLNKGVNETQYNFTSVPFTFALMNYDSGTQRFTFQFNFTTNDNGVWIEFYIISYDLAGYGLDSNGETRTTPAYDPSYTLTDDIRDNSGWTASGPDNGVVVRMGDVFITPGSNVDLRTAVTANGVQLGSVTGNYDNGTTITIVFTAPDADIIAVYIVYRNRTIDPITRQNVTNWSAYTRIQMTPLGGNQYTYTFPSSQTLYSIEFDYKFEYEDQFGNKAETEFVSEYFLNTLNQPIGRNPIIVDTVSPAFTDLAVTTNNTQTLPIAGRPLNNGTHYQIYLNETLTVSFNATDFDGSGVANITITVQYFDANGSLLESFTVVLYNSVVFGEGQIAFVSYKIPTTFYSINGTLRWNATIVDKFDNSVSVNANGPTLVITEPPQPVIPSGATVITSQIVTTINGTEVTLNITSTGLVTTVTSSGGENAIIVIFGFILGLIALVIYYRRHAIIEILQRRNRARLLNDRLRDITDDIVRLAKQGNYKESVLLIWQAFERACREALQAPRRYNMTARMYVAYISTVTTVDEMVLTTLAHIFEKARYGNEEITEDDWKEAFNALEVTVQTIIATGARRLILEDEDEEFDFEIEDNTT